MSIQKKVQVKENLREQNLKLENIVNDYKKIVSLLEEKCGLLEGKNAIYEKQITSLNKRDSLNERIITSQEEIIKLHEKTILDLKRLVYFYKMRNEFNKLRFLL